jgi:DNA-binding MarR family transcriptional regulator
LAERLPYRAHSVADYAAALQALATRGWVRREGEVYVLTDEGRRVREAAEAETARLFFVGWSALSEEERAALQDLLTLARDHLQEMVEADQD